MSPLIFGVESFHASEEVVDEGKVCLLVVGGIEWFADYEFSDAEIVLQHDDGRFGPFGNVVETRFELVDFLACAFGRHAEGKFFPLIENLDDGIDKIVVFGAIDGYASCPVEEPSEWRFEKRVFGSVLDVAFHGTADEDAIGEIPVGGVGDHDEDKLFDVRPLANDFPPQ